MRISITCEQDHHYTRIKPLAGALLRNGHDVRLVRPGRPAPRRADVRLHGLNELESEQLPGDTLAELLAFEGQLALFKNDDAPRFVAGTLPEELAARTRRFLVNYRWEDWRLIDPALRERLGFVNPLLDPLRANAGVPLAERRPAVVFYGAQTGILAGAEGGGELHEKVSRLPYPRLPPGGARGDGLRCLKLAGIELEGGLTHALYGAELGDLAVERVTRAQHLAALDRTAICFCPWGYAPLTYRLFEGLARRNLVVAQSLDGLVFPSGGAGLTSGVHYLEVRLDLADLADVVGAALEDLDAAQAVADLGHKHFSEHLAYRGLDLPQGLYLELVDSWGGLVPRETRRGLVRRVQGALLPYLKSLPQV